MRAQIGIYLRIKAYAHKHALARTHSIWIDFLEICDTFCFLISLSRFFLSKNVLIGNSSSSFCIKCCLCIPIKVTFWGIHQFLTMFSINCPLECFQMTLCDWEYFLIDTADLHLIRQFLSNLVLFFSLVFVLFWCGSFFFFVFALSPFFDFVLFFFVFFSDTLF